MREINKTNAALVGTAALLAIMTLPAPSFAQKIVCWKDKTGKVIGCGDKVPPEFQANATKELDKRGVTRGSTESVEEGIQRRTQQPEAARLKAEDERKLIDLKRQDTALLETYSSEKEIDLKRDRDLQVIDLQMEQLNTGLKSAVARYAEVKGRADTLEKTNKPVPPSVKDDLTRAAGDKERLEERIAAKQKEKEDLRTRYAEYRKRYADLRSGSVLPGQIPAQTPVAVKK
jgi:chromosome segregation ATPase